MQKIYILEGGSMGARRVYDSLDGALDSVVEAMRNTYREHCIDFYYEGKGNAVVRVRFMDPDRDDLTFTVEMHKVRTKMF